MHILDEVMDDYGVRRGKQRLEAARYLREFHTGNLEYLRRETNSIEP